MMRRAASIVSALAMLLAAGGLPALVQAAPAEKIQQAAGTVPTDAQAQAAIIKYYRARNRALNLRKPFKVLSGPTLATGNTFAGSLEQAWMMCIVVNAERVSPGPLELEGVSLYLRSLGGGQFSVVSTENWKDSSPQCR